jgi:hypothetical protein
VLLPEALLGSAGAAGERTTMAWPGPATGAASPESLPLAEIAGAGWQQGVYLPLRRHAPQVSDRDGGPDAAAEAGEPME